jgi:hypothetical protein
VRKRTLLGAVVCAAALTGLNVGAANAAGQVERGPEHANSECSFSGLNDSPGAAGPEGGRTQNFGQLVRAGVAPTGSSEGRAIPGFACNGHISPMKG